MVLGPRLGTLLGTLSSEICRHISDNTNCICPKYVYKYRTMLDLKQAVVDRIGDGPPAQVWTPVDFLDLGSRAAVEQGAATPRRRRPTPAD